MATLLAQKQPNLVRLAKVSWPLKERKLENPKRYVTSSYFRIFSWYLQAQVRWLTLRDMHTQKDKQTDCQTWTQMYMHTPMHRLSSLLCSCQPVVPIAENATHGLPGFLARIRQKVSLASVVLRSMPMALMPSIVFGSFSADAIVSLVWSVTPFSAYNNIIIIYFCSSRYPWSPLRSHVQFYGVSYYSFIWSQLLFIHMAWRWVLVPKTKRIKGHFEGKMCGCTQLVLSLPNWKMQEFCSFHY